MEPTQALELFMSLNMVTLGASIAYAIAATVFFCSTQKERRIAGWKIALALLSFETLVHVFRYYLLYRYAGRWLFPFPPVIYPIFIFLLYHLRTTPPVGKEKDWCGNRARDIIVILLGWTPWLRDLPRRAMFTEIGLLSGHVSDMDKRYSKENNIKPLNRFEKWLTKPWVEEERKNRRRAFRESMIEVLGEDPDEWVY